MLCAEIISCFEKTAALKTSENFSEFSVQCIFAGACTWPDVEHFIDFATNTSGRDNFELFLEIDGDIVSIIKIGDEEISSLKNHFRYHTSVDTPESTTIKINISKPVIDGYLSIYYLAAVQEYLSNESVTTLLNYFSSIFNASTGMTFEVFDTVEEFGTRTLRFKKYNQHLNIEPAQVENRSSILNKITENTSISGLNTCFIPEDFYLTTPSNSEQINTLFNNICSMLSIASIANTSSINGNGQIQFKINGYKTITSESRTIDSCCDCVEVSYKIHEWVYSEGECTDKLGLTRNVLSLHVNNEKQICFDDACYNAIISNYQIYLEKNITNYLELKNKITELVLESSAKVNQLCEEFLDSFKKNIVAFLTFFLTVVLVGGLKDNGAEAIFSPVFILVVVTLSAISLVWLLLLLIDMKARFDHSEEIIKFTLKANYNRILIVEEISEVIDPVIEKNKIFIKSQILKYSIAWVAFVVIILSSFFIGQAVLAKKPISSKTAPVNILKTPATLSTSSAYPTATKPK